MANIPFLISGTLNVPGCGYINYRTGTGRSRLILVFWLDRLPSHTFAPDGHGLRFTGCDCTLRQPVVGRTLPVPQRFTIYAPVVTPRFGVGYVCYPCLTHGLVDYRLVVAFGG